MYNSIAADKDSDNDDGRVSDLDNHDYNVANVDDRDDIIARVDMTTLLPMLHYCR